MTSPDSQEETSGSREESFPAADPGQPAAREGLAGRGGEDELFAATIVSRPPRPNLFTAGCWTVLLLVAQLVLAVGITFVVAAAFVAVTREPNRAAEFINGEFQQLLVPLATTSTFLFSVGLCFLLFGRRMGRVLGWRNSVWHQWVCVLLLAPPLQIVASEAANWAEEVVVRIEPPWLHAQREAGAESLHQLSAFPLALVFVFGCLLPGLGEEIYCRGFISRGLVARHGVVWGTLAASFLFGAMHVFPVQVCGTFLLGIGLQLVFLTTRSLPAAVALHAVNNLLAFLLMRYSRGFTIPGLSVSPDGNPTHTPPWLLLAALATTALLSILLIQSRTRWILPNGSIWSAGYPTTESPPAGVDARAVTGPPRLPYVAGAGVAYAFLIGALLLSVNKG